MWLRMSGKGSTYLFIVGVSVKCTTTVEISVEVLGKLGIGHCQYPAVPLLDIYLKNSASYYKDACSTMFSAAVLVVARH